jgi:hypothetical protein
MADAWDELRAKLGARAGAEFLQRLCATENGEVSLHVRNARFKPVAKWVAPPPIIDDGPSAGAQSDRS